MGGVSTGAGRVLGEKAGIARRIRTAAVAVAGAARENRLRARCDTACKRLPLEPARSPPRDAQERHRDSARMLRHRSHRASAESRGRVEACRATSAERGSTITWRVHGAAESGSPGVHPCRDERLLFLADHTAVCIGAERGHDGRVAAGRDARCCARTPRKRSRRDRTARANLPSPRVHRDKRGNVARAGAPPPLDKRAAPASCRDPSRKMPAPSHSEIAAAPPAHDARKVKRAARRIPRINRARSIRQSKPGAGSFTGRDE